MKITIKKEQLLKGLQTVQGIINNSSTLPIITNVLLSTTKDGLRMTTTDLDITISCAVEASVATEGVTTVSARKLFAIAKEMSGSEIEIETDEKNVFAVRCGKSFYRLNGLPADEFPKTPTVNGATVKIEQSDLKEMFQRTSFAMSVEATRFVLCGVYLDIASDSVFAVSSDGRRLSLASCEPSSKKTSAGKFIIPSKTVSEISRLIQTSGDVEVSHSEVMALFKLKSEGFDIEIYSKMIDSNYPDYRSIIPKGHTKSITLSRQELIGALKRAEVVTSEKTSSVKFSFSKNDLTISANSQEVGDASESIAIKYKGEDMSIAFNPKYILDALNSLNQEEVVFEMNDEISPLVIKIKGPFVYVLSPMRQA